MSDDLLDQKIGHLTIFKRGPSKRWPNGLSASTWICECDCGNIVTRTQRSLVPGSPKTSCGCGKKSRPHVYGFNVVLGSYRRGAALRGLSFELTEDQFRALLNGNCRYCGVGPSTSLKYDGRADHVFVYNGIDRVNNGIGYLVDNVVTCCKICNSAKSTLSEDEFLGWVCRIYNYSVRKP